ncbi:DUF3027 domain-containing protein [Actinomyces israelii]|uniref:DUF3027 domain-containing protein n=1 Tax=Actinomyces israelii TaxID=1659 RepID=UPI0025554F2A|nr:DUF3027 domain-containing protein [Actinomyces israelii]WKR22973.1 hypothetical protein AIF0345_2937 [Actinomyces israelii]
MTDAATDASTATGSGGSAVPKGALDQADVERPGSLPTKAESTAAAKDRTLTSPAAVERAREALYEITEPLAVGEHTAAKLQAERLVTHLFECNLAGYDGWRWAVTMARPPRSRTATVCELELLPGEGALLAPPWVPWADRLRSGDIGRSDRLPRRETDERLEPGWEAAGEEGDTIALDELDLGRARVLSPEGIQQAAQRWYDGEHGPDADGVRKAHASCSTCGFLLPIAGRMRHVFGVCANELAIDDGRVVSLDHGCGAHSETDLPDQGPEWPVTPSYMDDRALEPLGTDGASIRGGRGQAAERADAEAAAGDESASGAAGAPDVEEEPAAGRAGRAPAKAGKSPGRRRARRSRGAMALVPAPGKSAPDADEETEKPRRPEKPEKSVENPVAPQEEPARTSRSRRPARTRRTTAPREDASEAPRRPSAADEPAERAAAARDAVASLTARPPEHGAAPEAEGPTTLAELEARLPGRDRS